MKIALISYFMLTLRKLSRFFMFRYSELQCVIKKSSGSCVSHYSSIYYLPAGTTGSVGLKKRPQEKKEKQKRVYIYIKNK